MPKLLYAAARSLRTRLDRAESRSPRPATSPEPLEGRRLMSVTLDANGFTVVTPERGDRVVYVSSSAGSDGNDGLSPQSPVSTIAYGASLLRNNSGDQLLLARGDVWRETLGEWSKSGRGADEPMVVGAYGAGARPRLETGAATAFSISASSANVRHLDLIGLHLVASARVPGSPDFDPALSDAGDGLRVLARTDDFLVEDCVVQSYQDNVLLQDYRGPQSNVTIRRSIVVDAYSTTEGHSQGLYAYSVRGLTLEGNLFDHNGWNAAVPGAQPTIYNHNIYLSSSNTGVVIRGNIISNASSHGLQARSGGRVEDNLFLDNPVGMTFGVVKGATVTPGGVSGVVNGNVFLGNRDINGQGRGKGLEVGNTRPNIPTVVSNNIFSHAGDTIGGDYALVLSYAGDGSPNGDEAAGINDLTLQGNIVFRWTKGLRFDAGLVPGGVGRFALNRVTVRGNDFQQLEDGKLVMHDSPLDPNQEKWDANRYDTDPASASGIVVAQRGMTWARWKDLHEPDGQDLRAAYADPERTADTYSAGVTGVGDRATFVAAVRNAQSSQSWQPQLTAAAAIEYVRAGFAELDAPARDWRAPTAPIAVAGPPATPPSAGSATLTFTVTYGDDKSVDRSTVDGGDVTLVGRKGRVVAAASVVSVEGGGEGRPLLVTYAATPQDGRWDRNDKGKYSIVVNERQVLDNEGFFVAAGELARFKLKVAPPAPVDRPPTVSKLTFNHKGRQSIGVQFSEDVSATVSADDLVLTAEDGITIDPSLMTMTYDPARRTGTWTFDGLPDGLLPAGRYRATVLSSGVADGASQALDGDKDKAPGGDYVAPTILNA